jgi:hypothetical protein
MFEGLPRFFPASWKGQHTNPAKRNRRQLLKTLGRRQLLKRIKVERRRIKDVANG